MKEFVIDLFCGAGGTSTGVHLANCDSTVTACVNPLDVVNNCHASWPEAMKKCIKALVDCDGLFLLDDHDSSRGAMMDKSIAVSLCIPVYSRIADLRVGVGD